jgi:hypothetical protein
MNIESLFDAVQKQASLAYKKNPELNYQLVIENLQLVIDPSIRFTSWSENVVHGGILYQNITRKVMSLTERTINGYGEESIVDKNHFIIEIFRTPSKYVVPTLTALMTIAVYFGLLRTNLRDSDFPEGVVKIMRDFKAWSLISFMEQDRTTEITDELVEDILSVIEA